MTLSAILKFHEFFYNQNKLELEKLKSENNQIHEYLQFL